MRHLRLVGLVLIATWLVDAFLTGVVSHPRLMLISVGIVGIPSTLILARRRR